jgi:hypothetical protein
MLADWAAGLGSLVVDDVTWATACLHRQIRDWRVAEGVGTLSDHLYVMMELTPEPASTRRAGNNTRGPNRSRPPPTPRWRLKDRDQDLFQAAVSVSAWSWDARATQESSSIDEEAESLRKDISAACDASIPRSITSGGARNHGVYWWTEEIAESRRRCVQARRKLQRARRRRRRDEERIICHYEEYKEKRCTLQQEIRTAKARAWSELVKSVEADPWGRPYRLFAKKLRPPPPPH